MAKKNKITDLKKPATKAAPEWTTVKLPLEKLIEWQYNPVQLTKEDAKQIEISVRKFGLVEPLVANAPLKDGTRRLLDGHQRRKIMIYSKIADPKTKVDVRVPSRKLTARECDELTLRLRRNVGKLDYDMLHDLPEWDVPDFLNIGFDERELLGAGFIAGEQKEYDETIADGIKVCKCPTCGHEHAAKKD